MWGQARLLLATESAPADSGMSGADEETKGAGMSAGTSVGAAAPPQAMTETNAAVISTSKKNAGKFIGFTPRENYFNWGIITPAAGF